MPSVASSLSDLLVPGRAAERDPAVRSVLTDVLHTSLRQCGAIGLVGTLLYAAVGVFGLGYDLEWSYRAVQGSGGDQVVVMGTLIVAALSVIGLLLAQMRCSLRTGRLFGLGAVLLTAVVAMFEGALRGTYGTAYVIPMYLVIVAIVPFRPPQVLAMGGAVAAVVYALGPDGPVWGAAAVSGSLANHLAFVGGSAVLVTGTSVALYQRHRTFGTTQAQLQKNRDLLRRVQEVAQVGGWEYDPDAETVTGTKQLYRLLDFSPDRTIDREAGLSIYPPDARDDVADALRRCIEDGTPFDLEVPLDTGGDTDRWARVRGQARRRHGRTRRLTGTLQDITARKRREQALQRERDRFQTLFENLPTPVVHCALAPQSGTVQSINDAFAAVFATDSARAEGENLCTLIDSPGADSLEALIQQALGGAPQQMELQCETADGPRDFDLHLAVRSTAAGTLEGYFMFVDITERKKHRKRLEAEKEEAEEMSRLKSTFLANMSHEIRTPLTSILGFTEAIEDAVTGGGDPEVPITEFTRRIAKGGERLLETLDSVLNLSELEANAMDLTLHRVDLAAEAADTLDLFEREAETSNLTLRSELPAAPVPVRADQGALRRVHRNLLSNALKYTEDGGTVWVRVYAEDGAGVLEVEDTGIGMDPDRVDELFGAFEQASTGPSRSYEGSGLGLAVVERLVDRMDATIDVETEKGAGTCFQVRFPRSEEAPFDGDAPHDS